MRLVSKFLVSGSMLALGMGMMGSAASAATFDNASNNVQTEQQVSVKDALSQLSVNKLADYSTFITSDQPWANQVVNGQLTQYTDHLEMNVNLDAMKLANIGTTFIEVNDANGNFYDIIPASLNSNTGVLSFNFQQGVLQKGMTLNMVMFNSTSEYHIFSYTV